MENNMFKNVYEKYINERAEYYLDLYNEKIKKTDNVMVLVLHTFKGFREGCNFIAGREYKMPRKRAEELSGKENLANRVLVKIIK
jgi:ribonucleotide reductase beta subunit family protein with ferritin-like domain